MASVPSQNATHTQVKRPILLNELPNVKSLQQQPIASGSSGNWLHSCLKRIILSLFGLLFNHIKTLTQFPLRKQTTTTKAALSARSLATRSHNDYGCCTKGNLLRQSTVSGEIFTGHIKREVNLPESVLSSRRPFLMIGHWNNPRHTWWNAENVPCLLSCEMVWWGWGCLKWRFKAWLLYAAQRVIFSAGHYFWLFHGARESCTVPTRPRYSRVRWGKK